MSLGIWAKGGLVLLAGTAISGAVVGFTKLSPSTYSGSGVAARPRLVIARGNGSGAELSFNYDSFFGGGYQEGQQVPFNQVEMKFGDYKLQDGDLLCSPEQRGEYFVLRPTGKTHRYSRGLPTYTVDGYPDEVTGCSTRRFTNLEKFKKIKRVKLTGFRHTGTTGNSAGVDTIRVSNCSFSLEKTGGDSIGNIMASGCTTGSGARIDVFPISSQYEVN